MTGVNNAYTITKHTVRMARGQVWHDITYGNATTPTTSLPHTDVLPCERCNIVSAVGMMRYIRELINMNKSIEEAREVARGIFEPAFRESQDMAKSIDDVLAAIIYVDGEVRYTQI